MMRKSAKSGSGQKKHMNVTSMLMTGSQTGLESVRRRVDDLPYEYFPFCCSDNSVRKEVDMTQ